MSGNKKLSVGELFLPTAINKDGIHISAELRISAFQLRGYHIDWAAEVMERSAEHIDALELQNAERKHL